MKLIESKFVSNHEKMGDTTFERIKMLEVNGLNVYIFKRSRKDGSFTSFETFIAKRRYKGQPLPGGAVEAEDREQYPKGNAFGFTAKESRHLPMAEIHFNEFVQKLTKQEVPEPVEGEEVVNVAHVSGTRGRTKIEFDFHLPSGDFTMKEVEAANDGRSYGILYLRLKEAIAEGKVKVDGSKPNGGRGKPVVIYKNLEVVA